MFQVGDRVWQIRRQKAATVVRIVELTSGRLGFACEWKDNGKARVTFCRPDELKQMPPEPTLPPREGT